MSLQNALRAVELATSVCAMPDSEQQRKRLQEIEFAPGTRAKTLAKRRKSDSLCQTECDLLREFNEYGIELSDESGMPGRMISTALVFSQHLCRLPVSKHKAIVQLIRLRHLLIVTGLDRTTGNRREFIVKV